MIILHENIKFLFCAKICLDEFLHQSQLFLILEQSESKLLQLEFELSLMILYHYQLNYILFK